MLPNVALYQAEPHLDGKNMRFSILVKIVVKPHFDRWGKGAKLSFSRFLTAFPRFFEAGMGERPLVPERSALPVVTKPLSALSLANRQVTATPFSSLLPTFVGARKRPQAEPHLVFIP